MREPERAAAGREREARPRLRARPEDFVVEELELYPASGEGAHTFVEVEKRGLTTEQVARRLARLAGVSVREVGYAGRKDRRAVARQRFSVPGLDPDRARELEDDRLRVWAARRHPHKLRTGQHAGNRFQLVVRDVPEGFVAPAREAASRIARTGFPNRFGAQRYGRGGDNAQRGADLLRGGRGPRDRRQARFLLSAWQAALFDHVLASRPLAPEAVEWGDLAVVHESGGLFQVEDVKREQERAASGEISATGPIFGTRMRSPVGAPAEREAAALRHWGLSSERPLALPRGLRARGTRRAFRVLPRELRLDEEQVGEGVLRLRFELPPGAYATVLVEALLGPCDEGPGDA